MKLERRATQKELKRKSFNILFEWNFKEGQARKSLDEYRPTLCFSALSETCSKWKKVKPAAKKSWDENL